MIEFSWHCPKCGTDNVGDAAEAMEYTCVCKQCGTEYEIYLDVDIYISAIKEVP
ncbi:hypothetical protein MTAT_19720 [Moorella thermoacetica]|uniref:Uncharacterized protein n=1 Tax=Neomoorella thermoacetica TaxID=1525 RepID=A0AAC9HI88_NEOTH|nr:hypothetical protein [Moorella thermoacetica]AOQ24627.1 hypothetical protein Maut_02199 [Moorella thermoacetica]TYL12730.1 hypothetical protein MTAT_19720 [Moorella thermoacetica]